MDSVSTLRAWHDAVNAGDVEGAVAFCSDDVAVAGPRGTGHGHDLVRGWLTRSGIRLEPSASWWSATVASSSPSSPGGRHPTSPAVRRSTPRRPGASSRWTTARSPRSHGSRARTTSHRPDRDLTVIFWPLLGPLGCRWLELVFESWQPDRTTTRSTTCCAGWRRLVRVWRRCAARGAGRCRPARSATRWPRSTRCGVSARRRACPWCGRRWPPTPGPGRGRRRRRSSRTGCG